jgi:spore coat protein U-like protein
MKRVLKSLLLAGAALAVLAIARPASAQNIRVSANLPERCVIDATTNIVFAGFDGSADVDGTATITTRCTRGTTYTITLSEGDNAGTNTRQMAGAGTAAGEFLQYDLYQDSGYTTRWRAATPWSAPESPNNSQQFHTVWARLPAAGQADPKVGSYADTVLVSVNL